MIPINEKDEKDLDKIKEDNAGGFSFIVPHVLGELHYIIPKNNILLYGEVNMNNYNDINALYEKYSDIIGNHNRLRTNVNYETGEVTPVNGKYLMSETWNVKTWINYNLLMLGYPKRIMIFKKIK